MKRLVTSGQPGLVAVKSCLASKTRSGPPRALEVLIREPLGVYNDSRCARMSWGSRGGVSTCSPFGRAVTATLWCNAGLCCYALRPSGLPAQGRV